MSQHTPGPWEIRGDTMIVAHTSPILSHSEKSILATTDNPRLPADLCEANARLIAKAPEMYDFLRYLDNQWTLRAGTKASLDTDRVRLRALLREIEEEAETA